MTLGGGCEIVLHSARAQASAETYMGLVEVGVGLIPGAGGCKEMLLRTGDAKKAFELIAYARVSSSGEEARQWGLLRPQDAISMNPERLVADAKAAALALAPSWSPGAPRQDIKVEGEAGYALLKTGVYLAREGDYITDYDTVVGEKLAYVLSGGRLTGEQTDYYRAENVRTNLYNAFTYLARAFSGLEQEMRRGNVMPYAMSNARRTLSLMEREFSRWSVPDNLAYLDGKYVQARDATVYLIEKVDVGSYARRPFSSLESLFRFNYDRNRGTDPWKFRVQVPDELLQKMRVGAPIELTFEGQMVMLAGGGRNRAVYRIEDGRKRVIARPDLLNRYGGWARVFEVPREVIDRYPDGTPIDR
jgi:hypothetical protein